MKIIKPSIQFYGAVPTEYNAALKFIEMAGRTCYKSEDKITEDSAEGFVKKLIKAGHLAMVEHSNFVAVFNSPYVLVSSCLGKYLNSVVRDGCTYVGGNLTAWYQQAKYNGFYAQLFQPFMDEYGPIFGIDAGSTEPTWEACPHDEIPKELHRYSAKFICDRAISHELVRHRPCSFAQESTRYVNYGGKDMEFIEPWWMADEENRDDPGWDIFSASCRVAEMNYNQMMDIAVHNSPQACRAVLPNALKTEIVVTADLKEWEHLFKLRCSHAAHPDFRRLAIPLRDKFIAEGIL